MGRIKIALPDTFIFSTTLTIQVSDLNYGNHLGNDKVLSFAHEIRMRWLNQINQSELDFFGTSLIQGDAGIVYHSEGFYGDHLQASLGFGEISRSSFELIYKIDNTTTGKSLATVKTGMVCFDYDTRKVKEIPEKFREYVKAI